MQTPVVLVVFNRPDVTAAVLEEVAKAKPPKLFVVADGPRTDRPGEAELCAATQALFNRVDWECEVHKNFSDVNLGVKYRTATGLTWVFDQVEDAIILEDDCLPDPTFFPYCAELLERYRLDTRIMQIAGTNFQVGHKRTSDSYHFSRYPTSTGWATWRRAWQHFDAEFRQWPAFRDGDWLFDWLHDRRAARRWAKDFESQYRGQTRGWAICWVFTCWTQGALSIAPNVNLIANIGYRPDATHTTSENWLSAVQAQPIKFPLQHPPFVMADQKADRFNYYSRFGSGKIERAFGKAWRLWRTYKHKFGIHT